MDTIDTITKRDNIIYRIIILNRLKIIIKNKIKYNK